jgi:hypothetical protein
MHLLLHWPARRRIRLALDVQEDQGPQGRSQPHKTAWFCIKYQCVFGYSYPSQCTEYGGPQPFYVWPWSWFLAGPGLLSTRVCVRPKRRPQTAVRLRQPSASTSGSPLSGLAWPGPELAWNYADGLKPQSSGHLGDATPLTNSPCCPARCRHRKC